MAKSQEEKKRSGTDKTSKKVKVIKIKSSDGKKRKLKIKKRSTPIKPISSKSVRIPVKYTQFDDPDSPIAKRKSKKHKKVMLPKSDSLISMEIKPVLLDKKKTPISLFELEEKNPAAFKIISDRLANDVLQISKVFEKIPNENETLVKWSVLSFQYREGSLYVKVQKANGAKLFLNKEAELKNNIRSFIDWDKEGPETWMKDGAKILTKQDLENWDFKKAHLKLGLKIIVMTLE